MERAEGCENIVGGRSSIGRGAANWGERRVNGFLSVSRRVVWLTAEPWRCYWCWEVM